jgi:hypothetical protein
MTPFRCALVLPTHTPGIRRQQQPTFGGIDLLDGAIAQFVRSQARTLIEES